MGFIKPLRNHLEKLSPAMNWMNVLIKHRKIASKGQYVSCFPPWTWYWFDKLPNYGLAVINIETQRKSV